MDGCQRNRVNVVSGETPGSDLARCSATSTLRVFLYILENNLFGYADDCTLVALVSSLFDRVAVSKSLNRELNR